VFYFFRSKSYLSSSQRLHWLWDVINLICNHFRGSFYGVKGRSVKLTTHPYLVPAVRLLGGKILFPDDFNFIVPLTLK
jgi:hypothetical protein